jgi:hypothetical protein
VQSQELAKRFLRNTHSHASGAEVVGKLKMSQAPRDDLSTGEDSGWQDLDLAWAGEILVKDKAGQCGQALLKKDFRDQEGVGHRWTL